MRTEGAAGPGAQTGGGVFCCLLGPFGTPPTHPYKPSLCTLLYPPLPIFPTPSSHLRCWALEVVVGWGRDSAITISCLSENEEARHRAVTMLWLNEFFAREGPDLGSVLPPALLPGPWCNQKFPAWPEGEATSAVDVTLGLEDVLPWPAGPSGIPPSRKFFALLFTCVFTHQ